MSWRAWVPTLNERFVDPEIKALCTGMFSLDDPKYTRFSIDSFTSIELGALTEETRNHLKVSQTLNSLFCTRADALFPRTRPT